MKSLRKKKEEQSILLYGRMPPKVKPVKAKTKEKLNDKTKNLNNSTKEKLNEKTKSKMGEKLNEKTVDTPVIFELPKPDPILEQRIYQIEKQMIEDGIKISQGKELFQKCTIESIHCVEEEQQLR